MLILAGYPSLHPLEIVNFLFGYQVPNLLVDRETHTVSD